MSRAAPLTCLSFSFSSVSGSLPLRWEPKPNGLAPLLTTAPVLQADDDAGARARREASVLNMLG